MSDRVPPHPTCPSASCEGTLEFVRESDDAGVWRCDSCGATVRK